MSENIEESEVEMVISTVLKPVLDILFCLGSTSVHNNNNNSNYYNNNNNSNYYNNNNNNINTNTNIRMHIDENCFGGSSSLLVESQN